LSLDEGEHSDTDTNGKIKSVVLVQQCQYQNYQSVMLADQQHNRHQSQWSKRLANQMHHTVKHLTQAPASIKTSRIQPHLSWFNSFYRRASMHYNTVNSPCETFSIKSCHHFK